MLVMERDEMKEHYLKSEGRRVWVTYKNSLDEFLVDNMEEVYPTTKDGKALILDNLVDNNPVAVSRIFVLIDDKGLGKNIYIDEDILDSISVEYYKHRYKNPLHSEFEQRKEEIEKLQLIINTMINTRGYRFYRAKGELD